jgi:hypothetical protein
MARISRVLAAIIVAFAIGACGSDSSLPVATGKASIRMINAIPTSPEIGFLIEERALDAVRYKSNSSPESWDDLEYTFNFEINRPFENELTRIASQFLDVTREIEYTFLVRGSLDAAVVDVWQIPERSFSGSETIFEMRVVHSASSTFTLASKASIRYSARKSRRWHRERYRRRRTSKRMSMSLP